MIEGGIVENKTTEEAIVDTATTEDGKVKMAIADGAAVEGRRDETAGAEGESGLDVGADWMFVAGWEFEEANDGWGLTTAGGAAVAIWFPWYANPSNGWAYACPDVLKNINPCRLSWSYFVTIVFKMSL